MISCSFTISVLKNNNKNDREELYYGRKFYSRLPIWTFDEGRMTGPANGSHHMAGRYIHTNRLDADGIGIRRSFVRIEDNYWGERYN